LSPNTVGCTMSVYQEHNFFLTHCCWHCFSISESTVLTSATVVYTVSVYQSQQFFPHILLAALCHYIRHNTFILARCGLQIVSIAITTVLSSTTLGNNGSWYQKKVCYHHRLLVKMFQFISQNIFTQSHCWLHSISTSD